MNVDGVKVQDAYENWFFTRTSYEGYVQCSDPIMNDFWTFLGLPPVWPDSGSFEMSPEAASKVEMLLSPHHETIIKAYYARKDHGPQDNN